MTKIEALFAQLDAADTDRRAKSGEAYSLVTDAEDRALIRKGLLAIRENEKLLRYMTTNDVVCALGCPHCGSLELNDDRCTECGEFVP
jgi:hypothetical protein